MRSESRKRFWNLAPRFSRRMRVVSTRSAIGGVFQIDDPFVDQVGEIEHAAVGDEIAGERRAEHGAAKLEVAGADQRQEAVHVERPELIRVEA